MVKFFHQYARKLCLIIIVLLFSTSLWQFATASWIQGKAVIAQQLLNHSWKQTVNNSQINNFQDSKIENSIHKPWPWADTWPVAKLIAPQHNIEQIVLAGDNGSSLAFGPGHSFASATPNTSGLTMISGHRDTHFNFLQELKLNDIIYVQTADKIVQYRIYDFKIVDSKTFTLASSSDEHILVLVTCYPFDAIRPGGSLRYLVYANKQVI